MSGVVQPGGRWEARVASAGLRRVRMVPSPPAPAQKSASQSKRVVSAGLVSASASAVYKSRKALLGRGRRGLVFSFRSAGQTQVTRGRGQSPIATRTSKYACAKGSGELVELIAHGFRRRRELWRLNSVSRPNLPQIGFITRGGARGLDSRRRHTYRPNQPPGPHLRRDDVHAARHRLRLQRRLVVRLLVPLLGPAARTWAPSRPARDAVGAFLHFRGE